VGVAVLQAETGVAVRWTGFPLHPETPPDGTTLEELFAGRGIDVETVLARLRRVAAEVGVPLGDRRRTYNSRRAQELARWAQSRGFGDAFRERAFRAYFAEGRNLWLPEELARIAEAAGLPGLEALDALADPRWAQEVDADWARARRLEVNAVPTHVFGGRVAAGFLPHDDLVRFVGGAGKERRRE
jgi:predicted DsbA family dithiol-disulfide isomerase